MSEHPSTTRINVQQLAEGRESLEGCSLLLNMTRLAADLAELPANSMVSWQLEGDLVAASTGEDSVHLHLTADAVVRLVCQRCLAPVSMALHVDNSYRFVADEETAMREDDESDEDLLVWDANFDLAPLLEDELLMALPVVPMHDRCPNLEGPSASQSEKEQVDPPKPNPFSVLAGLKPPNRQ